MGSSGINAKYRSESYSKQIWNKLNVRAGKDLEIASFWFKIRYFFFFSRFSSITHQKFIENFIIYHTTEISSERNAERNKNFMKRTSYQLHTHIHDTSIFHLSPPQK